jgi:aspartate aminotransferase
MVSSPVIAGRAATMGRSLIRVVAEQAWAIPDAIRLELGEPSHRTPEHVIEAAHRAARGGATRYAPNGGLPQLRDAIAEKIANVNGYRVRPEDVVVGAGGVEVLFATLTALLVPGDQVLLPDPSWPDYRMMCELLGAEVVYYGFGDQPGHAPDPEALAALITPRTRALIVNSPSNPLGAVHPPQLLAELADLAAAHDLWVVSDECYDQLTFAGNCQSLAAVAPQHHQRIVSLYSFSKVHAMTGWRVGYAAMPPVLAERVADAQEPLISCVNTPAQHAALAALKGPQDHIAAMRESFSARSRLVSELLTEVGVRHVRPDGTFYVWAELGEVGRDSLGWALALLDEERVAVAPGEAFGPAGAGCIRLSLGEPDETLIEGVRRMLAKIKRDRDHR